MGEAGSTEPPRAPGRAFPQRVQRPRRPVTVAPAAVCGAARTPCSQKALLSARHGQRECTGVLHEHRPQLQKVIVLWVLHLHDAPWVEAASDLLALGFDQLIGPDHREWDTGLERDARGRLGPHGEAQFSL